MIRIKVMRILCDRIAELNKRWQESLENIRKLSEQMQTMSNEMKIRPRFEITPKTPTSELLESSISPPPSVTINVGVERIEQYSGNFEHDTWSLEHLDSATIEIQCEEVAGTLLECTPTAILRSISSPNFPELNVSNKRLNFDSA